MEEIKCQKCGQTLKLSPWSIGKDILMCENGKCPAYRNPISSYSYGNRLENKTSKKSYKELDLSYAPPLPKSNVSPHPQATQFQLALRCTSLIISGK
jgi:hypothetical protein